MTMRIPLPESLRPPAGVVASAVVPRDAATIAVVRDGENGLETYLLRRRSTLEFAPGMLVFPGGGVHDGDLRVTDWIGPDAAAWAVTFDCDETLARGLPQNVRRGVGSVRRFELPGGECGHDLPFVGCKRSWIIMAGVDARQRGPRRARKNRMARGGRTAPMVISTRQGGVSRDMLARRRV